MAIRIRYRTLMEDNVIAPRKAPPTRLPRARGRLGRHMVAHTGGNPNPQLPSSRACDCHGGHRIIALCHVTMECDSNVGARHGMHGRDGCRADDSDARPRLNEGSQLQPSHVMRLARALHRSRLCGADRVTNETNRSLQRVAVAHYGGAWAE